MPNTTLNRRDFLRTAWTKTHKLKPPQATPLPPPLPLETYNGDWTRATVVHLLKRTTFGAKKADIDYFLGLGMSASVDELLNACAGVNASQLPPTPPDDYNSELWQGTWPEFNQGQLYNYLANNTTTVPAIATLVTQLQNLNPPPPVVDFNTDELDSFGVTYVDTSVPLGKTWVLSQAGGLLDAGSLYSNEHASYERHISYYTWLVKLMINTPRSIREKMTLFWSNFFPIDISKSQCCTYPIYNYWYNANLRHYCLGNYKDLLKSVTTSPGMLMMLDGAFNTVNTPNQNYGRELQEIYAIGLPASTNPNESYTEQDVVEVSRILTGWTFNYPGCRSEFILAKHDTGNKQLSAFYNNALITGGNTIASAKAELDALLNIIYTKPQTALNVCRKIYRFFVNSDIDSNIESTIIEPLAQLLRDNDYNILPVMQTLLKSEHFYSMTIRGGMVKPPTDFVIGIFREYDLWLYKTEDLPILEHEAYGRVIGLDVMRDLGHSLDMAPSAFGLRAYYDAPAYDKHWINATLINTRRNVANRLLSDFYNRYNATCMCERERDFNIRFDPIPFVQNLTGNTMTASNIVQQLQDNFCVVALCSEAQQQLLAALNPIAESDWATVWAAYLANPSNTTLLNIVKTRLRNVCILFNQLEETHLI
jgi:hypothetical protein